jgi:hypothetical protein
MHGLPNPITKPLELVGPVTSGDRGVSEATEGGPQGGNGLRGEACPGRSYCPKLWIGAELKSADCGRSLSSFHRKGDQDERTQRTYDYPLLDEGRAQSEAYFASLFNEKRA